MAGALAHLKLFQVRLGLVAIGAIEFLAFDLILVFKMGLVDKCYLFRIFDLLGFEVIPGFAMTVGGHAGGIIDFRTCLDD